MSMPALPSTGVPLPGDRVMLIEKLTELEEAHREAKNALLLANQDLRAADQKHEAASRLAEQARKDVNAVRATLRERLEDLA